MVGRLGVVSCLIDSIVKLHCTAVSRHICTLIFHHNSILQCTDHLDAFDQNWQQLSQAINS